jgi:hypothetical protein
MSSTTNQPLENKAYKIIRLTLTSKRIKYLESYLGPLENIFKVHSNAI